MDKEQVVGVLIQITTGFYMKHLELLGYIDSSSITYISSSEITTRNCQGQPDLTLSIL